MREPLTGTLAIRLDASRRALTEQTDAHGGSARSHKGLRGATNYISAPDTALAPG
jgi:hypothetical protein